MAYQIRHTILVYDKAGKNLLAKFSPGVSGEQTSFYRNLKYDYREGVSNIAFEVRIEDPKTEVIQEGNWVEIWRLGEPVRRGVIKPLTPTKDLKWFQVNAFGDGVQLKNYSVPTKWEWWNNWDLAEIFRALLWAMEWKIWSDHANWVRCTLDKTQTFSLLEGDSNTINENILLASDENHAYVSSGSIVSEVIEKPSNAEWYVLEAQDSVAENTSLTYSVRSGPTGIPNSSWSTWTELARTTALTKSWSIAGQTGRYLQWKAELTTEDTTTEREGGIKGSTPVIYALRLVCRYPLPNVKAANLPNSFDIQAVEFKPDNEDYLEVIKKLCEKYDIRYWFDCDWTEHNTRMWLSLNPGVDRSTEPGCIFRQNRDFKSLDVQIDRNDYCNYLHLFGAGEGLDQLYDFVKDDAEIADRGGIVYGKLVDTECTDLEKLREKGQEELDKRKKGKYAIEMRVPGLRFSGQGKFPFDLFDWIYINAPAHRINYKHQIIEMSVVETGKGESMGFKLGNKMLSTETILDNLRKKANQEYYPPGNARIPNPPVNVTARSANKRNELSCLGQGKAFEWYYSLDGIQFAYLKTVNTQDTEHRGKIDTRYWYKVRQQVGGCWSAFSKSVSSVIQPLSADEIELPPAKPPKQTWVLQHFLGGSNKAAGHRITWEPPEEDVAGVVIKRTERQMDGSEKESYFQTTGQGREYLDTTDITPGASYRYAVQFVNKWGQASGFVQTADSITAPVATENPSKPKGLTATATLKIVTLHCTPNTDLGIAGYEWRYTEDPVTNVQLGVSLPGNECNNTFAGTYDKKYNFWVRAYTLAGGSRYYSDWAGPVSAQITQATGDDLKKTQPAIPVKPTVSSIVTGLPSSAIISNRIQWSPPAGITMVDIQRKEGSVVTHFSAPAVGGVYADEAGIKPGTTYEYSIRYINEWGQLSPNYSPIETVTTATGVTNPAAPTGLSVSTAFRKAFLRCNLGTDLGLAGYEWRYAEDPVTNVQLGIGIPGSECSNTFTGTYDKKYNFWVRAYTLAGGSRHYSDWAGPVSAQITQVTGDDLKKTQPVIPVKPTVGSIVTGLPSFAIISNRIQWSPPAGITMVDIQRKEGSVITHFTAPAVGGVYADEAGIKPGTTYEYSIRYINEWGQLSPNYSPVETVTTAAGITNPATPTGLSASVMFRKAFLRCNLGTDLGLAGYEWRYSTSGSNPDTATSIPGDRNIVTFSGTSWGSHTVWVRSYTIVNGTTHYSNWSAPETFTFTKASKDEISIFIDGILDPEILSAVLQKYTFDINGSYTGVDVTGSNPEITSASFIASTQVETDESKNSQLVAEERIPDFSTAYPQGRVSIPVEKCVFIPADRQWIGKVIPKVCMEMNVPLGESVTQLCNELGIQFELAGSPAIYLDCLQGGPDGNSYQLKNIIVTARWRYKHTDVTSWIDLPYPQINWQILEMADHSTVGSSIPGIPLE